MKKVLSAFLLALFLLGSAPSFAYATSSTTNGGSIDSLLAQISALMRQINELNAQVKTLKSEVRTVVKEEKKEDKKPKAPVLIQCAGGDGEYAWTGWENGNGKKKKGKYGWSNWGKNQKEFRKFIRYCREKGTASSTDVTAPSISSITVANVTTNTATITWTTDEISNSFVAYGTTANYGATSSNLVLTKNHTVTLTGLTANTLYNFQVRSSDWSGNLVVSSNMTFTTGNTSGDVVSPVILSVTVSNIGVAGATVTWTTNEPSDSQVSYGTTASYGSTTTLDAALVTNHSVTLAGLSSSTLYHIAVRSKDASANLAVSPDVSFTTSSPVPSDVTSPVVSSVAVSNITASGATITWTTNEGADSQVVFGTTASYGSTTTLDATLVTSHSVTLTGLSASSAYHFAVRSKDAATNLTVSPDVSFTTSAPADVTAPVISGISATVGSTTAGINWTTNENANSKIYFGTVTPLVLGSASTLANASLVTAHTLSLSSLSASTTYYYVVESTDGSSNVSTSSQQSFTTGN